MLRRQEVIVRDRRRWGWQSLVGMIGVLVVGQEWLQEQEIVKMVLSLELILTLIVVGLKLLRQLFVRRGISLHNALDAGSSRSLAHSLTLSRLDCRYS